MMYLYSAREGDPEKTEAVHEMFQAVKRNFS